MSRLLHLYEPGMTYLLSAVTHRREIIFANASFAQAAHEDMAFYARKFDTNSLAHVIMPDHVHWVIHPSPQDFERFAREEKRAASTPMHPNGFTSARSWKITSGPSRLW